MSRSYTAIGSEDLRRLAALAKTDREDLLRRNADLARLYSDRLLAVALCQGAAMHYVDQKNGVKDFDLWSFFIEHPERQFPPRRRAEVDFGDPKFGVSASNRDFVGRKVDLMGRSISPADPTRPVAALQEYLTQRKTASAQWLAEKAVVLLEPDGLREQSKTAAPPEVFNLVDWDASQAKPLPAVWPRGRRIGFRTRVCPVVRGPKGHGQTGAEAQKGQPEVDAYLARCWQQDEAPDREAVYREWVMRELGRDGAAEAVAMRMIGFRLKRALRRNSDRRSRAITRPDALFKGTLRIVDPSAFQRLLARGLGRHRGFGFGMLLLTAEERG